MTTRARAKLKAMPAQPSSTESSTPPTTARPRITKKVSAAASGADTRLKIIDATLECLRTEGIADTSTRAIARIGNFNQALVFYHFGSMEQLLIAASVTESDRRSARYQDRLATVTSFPELVKVARALHDEEVEQGSVAVLTQLLAASTSSDALKQGIYAGLDPWMHLLEEALDRVLAGSPWATALPARELAFAISSLFIGVEMMAGLDAERQAEQRLFNTIESLGFLVDALLQMTPPK